ncbi:DNA ligase [Clostridia bacterium]|nr:DNA ligase [Clostridia bacterium]
MNERINELTEKLNAAAKAYYSTGKEIMTDREYDALYDELAALERETGERRDDSPTRRVGYETVSELTKIAHEAPMLSLDKTKEPEKLAEFLGERAGLLSWKMDGLTIVVTYRDGKLNRAVTRGNGVVGEDVTHNAAVFRNLPRVIPEKGTITIRGEAVISYADFAKINENLPETEGKYKNPRNLCSGTIRQLNSRICAERGVSFYAFSLVSVGAAFQTKSEALSRLKEMGFETAGHKIVAAETVEAAVAEFSEAIVKNPFPSDGLVLTFDDIAYSESLGSTSKFPRDSIAFKWADELAETTLLRVEWNTSRTGLINPVAVFSPVEIEGSTVERASVHNVSVLEGLSLSEGDTVTVYKANMIIPQVAENLTRRNKPEIPSTCPACGFSAVIAGENDARFLKCENPNCRAKLISFITHFVSRDAMNIEGFSEKTIEKFTEKGFLNAYTDIFSLKKHAEEIGRMDGFGEKSLTKLLSAIEAAKTRETFRFVYALGIAQIGLAGAKLLCAAFDYDLDKIKNAREDELTAIDGFGEATAAEVCAYFANTANRELFDSAVKLLMLTKPEINENLPLSGQTFVITGKLARFTNRNELVSLIEKNGGKSASSVSAKTSFLINNDVSSQSGKNKDAAKFGVKIISEEEFLEMLKL